MRISFFVFITRPPPRATPFPYTTLFRSASASRKRASRRRSIRDARCDVRYRARARPHGDRARARYRTSHRDRKSTRLNSSHLGISYAVFCLKKKKKRYTLEPQVSESRDI